jgi:hypothetical protein
VNRSNPVRKSVFGVELGVSVDLPCEIAHTERAPRDEPDAQIFADLEHAVLFRVALHERILGLDRRHRLHGMRTPDGRDVGF